MRVMVTGGAGFIGSTLVDRLLAEGCDVDAIDDLSTGALANLSEARAQRNRKLSFHRHDVRSPQLGDIVAHRKPEVIFHLAAQLDVRVSVAKPRFDAEVNVLGSLNVCEAALAAGTRKVVFAGSGGTLYGVPESLPVRESHPQDDLGARVVVERPLDAQQRHDLPAKSDHFVAVDGPHVRQLDPLRLDHRVERDRVELVDHAHQQRLDDR